jgi:hypothetical protein
MAKRFAPLTFDPVTHVALVGDDQPLQVRIEFGSVFFHDACSSNVAHQMKVCLHMMCATR